MCTTRRSGAQCYCEHRAQLLFKCKKKCNQHDKEEPLTSTLDRLFLEFAEEFRNGSPEISDKLRKKHDLFYVEPLPTEENPGPAVIERPQLSLSSDLENERQEMELDKNMDREIARATELVDLKHDDRLEAGMDDQACVVDWLENEES
jgi:hypothetical protein